MVGNIEKIARNETSLRNDGLRAVKITFKFPCKHTFLTIEDLKKILKEWILGEEEKYPISKGYKGRWLLFEEIKKVFEETKEVV